MQIFYVQISESAWTLRHTTRTGEATKINKNTIGGSRQLKLAVTTHRFILLPVCVDILSIVRPHIRRHHTLPSRHLFLRRRHPLSPTLASFFLPVRPNTIHRFLSCHRVLRHPFIRRLPTSVPLRLNQLTLSPGWTCLLPISRNGRRLMVSFSCSFFFLWLRSSFTACYKKILFIIFLQLTHATNRVN